MATIPASKERSPSRVCGTGASDWSHPLLCLDTNDGSPCLSRATISGIFFPPRRGLQEGWLHPPWLCLRCALSAGGHVRHDVPSERQQREVAFGSGGAKALR